MKKSLKKLQALIIAFAVVVSFGFSTAHSYSGNVGEHDLGMILVDSSAPSPAIQALNCDGHEDHCDYDSTQHSHVSHCCMLTSQAPIPDQLEIAGTSWSEKAKNLIETVSVPPLRPPRFSA
ncbi:MAG: hypothetical protein ISR51_06145 [Rhodospirillales bacterium]|nr:hypothetical protein [Alphaproteobacteria bacterium]MBL6948240.1 hypothetical protein [Rhodospirillales bacterium]